jgi:hypothetical protein
MPKKPAIPADCMPMCKTCAFYLVDPGADFGECRRFPPVMVQEGEGYTFSFPVVNADDFCGEFKRRTN